ncbi:MAG: hypothetical protein IPM60_03500 [Rhodospirillales bacterium]|nr:hypothetical protein [Rhodospirillales bacterium]
MSFWDWVGKTAGGAIAEPVKAIGSAADELAAISLRTGAIVSLHPDVLAAGVPPEQAVTIATWLVALAGADREA